MSNLVIVIIIACLCATLVGHNKKKVKSVVCPHCETKDSLHYNGKVFYCNSCDKIVNDDIVLVTNFKFYNAEKSKYDNKGRKIN